MPIRNRDGSLFKLQGVNPLMESQDRWEEEEWKIHYIEGEKTVVEDPKRTIPENLPPEIAVPAIVGVGIISPTELLYCLPLVIQEVEDDLYGQKKRLTSWGDKFNFEAIRTDYTGLTATFFAKIPEDYVKKLERGSIIFVFKERQWWKLNGVEKDNDGIRIYCVPSELKPSFV